jgi:hypothetical protein
MKARRSSETSVLTRSTWRNIPEDATLHSHRRENLKSYITPTVRHFLGTLRMGRDKCTQGISGTSACSACTNCVNLQSATITTRHPRGILTQSCACHWTQPQSMVRDGP